MIPTEQKNKNTLKPLIVIVLTALLAFVVGYIIYQVVYDRQTDSTSAEIMSPPENEKPIKNRSTMFFDPSKVSVSKDDTFTIEIVADALGNTINGADSVVKFDETMLEAISIEKSQETPSEFYLARNIIEDGQAVTSIYRTVFDDTPNNLVPIANITFRAIAPGVTVVKLDHIQGSTRGSTVIRTEDSSNILDAVNEAVITIQ